MENKNNVAVEENVLPVYEIPMVTTYTDEAILEELGPAQANVYEVDSATSSGSSF